MTKTALVTGSSRGIGRGIALELGKEGYHIIVNYSGSEDKANAVVGEIKEAGGSAESYQCHVENFDDVKAMIKYITGTRFDRPCRQQRRGHKRRPADENEGSGLRPCN